jgi:hypothetical protein
VHFVHKCDAVLAVRLTQLDASAQGRNLGRDRIGRVTVVATKRVDIGFISYVGMVAGGLVLAFVAILVTLDG